MTTPDSAPPARGETGRAPRTVLAVDVGTVRIGLARSDASGRIALPIETVAASPHDEACDRVARVARELRVVAIVVGLPLTLEGEEGVAARRSRRFARSLGSRVPCPVVFWDERLTTVVAEQALAAAAVRGARRKAVVDQAAATLLLQNYLDRRSAR